MMPTKNCDNGQNINRINTKMSENFQSDDNSAKLLDDSGKIDTINFYGNNKNDENDINVTEDLNIDYDDHMYANNIENGELDNADVNCQNTESEVKFWKEWLILHLDLIQQQSDEILDKERTILILQQENEMLKERISCMERGAPYQPKIYNNHTAPYIDDSAITEEDNMTQDSSACDEDNKNCIDFLDLNCGSAENGENFQNNSNIKLINFDEPTQPTQTQIHCNNIHNSDIESHQTDNNTNTNTNTNTTQQQVVNNHHSLFLNTTTDHHQKQQVEQQEEQHQVEHQQQQSQHHELKQEEVDEEEEENRTNQKTGEETKNLCYSSRNIDCNLSELSEQNIKSDRDNLKDSEHFDFTINSCTTTSEFDPMRNLRMSIRRKRLSNSSAVSNDIMLEEKRPFRRFKKRRKRVVKDSQMLTTTDQYVTQAGDTNLVNFLKPDVPPMDNLNTNLEVPRWRIKVYGSCYTMEGTENLDDEVYNKRHSRLEIDERRRKRWDVQRIREQRVIEKLKQRQERTASGSRSDDQNEIQSLWPKLEDIRYIEITEQLPVSAFGCPIPKITPSEFSLPWLTNPNLIITKKVPSKKSTSRRKRR